MSGFIYLGSPYSAPTAELRQERFEAALHVTAALLRAKQWVYSPIVHCHELTIKHELPFDFDFWQNYNFTMLAQADQMYMLDIPGWEQSKGLAGEMAFARANGIELYFVTPVLEIEHDGKSAKATKYALSFRPCP